MKFKVFAAVLLLAFSATSYGEENSGNWMVRLRAISLSPNESGSPTVVGGDAKLNNDSVPEIDFTYFFNDCFALELVAATTTHHVMVAGASSGTSNLDLGDVSLLPPTLLAQYHFQLGKAKPYVGAGLNYTIFYDQIAGGQKSVEYKDSVGFALQVGVDVPMENNFYLNLDAKKVFLSTDLEVTTLADATVTADVKLDPWVFGLGMGYRF